MVQIVQQVHNIKPGNEHNSQAMPFGFKNRLKYFACSLSLYVLKRV